jgi:L-cysteine S-thiosulfotransferase
MKKPYLLSLLVLFALPLIGLIAADPAPRPGGFRFPGGDATDGRDSFIGLNCVQCHSINKVELPDPKGNRRLELTLANEIRFVKKYEDIITAITNPKHVVTEQYRAILTKAEVQGGIEPLMPDFTNDMSARQLMDIVAFLDEVYRKALPEYGAR